MLRCYAAHVERCIASQSNAKLEAIALHECYRELDGNLSLPILAVRFESLDASTEEPIWNPADWPSVCEYSATEALQKCEADLYREATKGSQTHWSKCEAKLLTACLKVAKSLYKQYAKHPSVTKDFVVYFDDEVGGLEWIEETVPPKLFEKLFSAYKQSVVDIPPGVVDPRLFEDLVSHEEKILALGDAAIEPLIVKLDDPSLGYLAATYLGKLQKPTPRVIEALRSRLTSTPGVSTASANALALLNDMEFLFQATHNENHRKLALSGILHRIKRASQAYIPLDYRWLERILALGQPAITEIILNSTKPEIFSAEIKPSDVDEALRGLQSPYEVVQLHATMALGDRALGKEASKKILPALVHQLQNPSPAIRRMAILSLSFWKAAAKPYHAEMRKCLEDPVSMVRSAAGSIFNG